MSMNNGRSYSQQKRDKLDYRREYFKHNPGIFGCVWTCAYCHRPLVGKNNVVVDHIMPLNNVLGRNARYNLVAACQKCNLKKSDKVDYRVAKGYVSKAFEVMIFSVQKVLIIAIVAIWTCIQKAFDGLKQMLFFPIYRGSMPVKIIAIVIYAVIVGILLSRF